MTTNRTAAGLAVAVLIAIGAIAFIVANRSVADVGSVAIPPPDTATAGAGPATNGQITSSQTSEVPSDAQVSSAPKDEPTLAQNPNTSMEASSGATRGASEASATTAAAGAGPASQKAP